MGSQAFGLGHFTGIAVVGLILLIIAVIIITFMSFGNTTELSLTGNPLNMQRSNGQTDCNLINRGNVMFVHDMNPDGSQSDIILNVGPNYKNRIGKRQGIKNNTSNSTITLVPIDGVILQDGFIHDPNIVGPGDYAILLSRRDGSLLRLQ